MASKEVTNLVLDSEIIISADGELFTAYWIGEDLGHGTRPLDGVAWTETGRMLVDRHEEYEER